MFMVHVVESVLRRDKAFDSKAEASDYASEYNDTMARLGVTDMVATVVWMDGFVILNEDGSTMGADDFTLTPEDEVWTDGWVQASDALAADLAMGETLAALMGARRKGDKAIMPLSKPVADKAAEEEAARVNVASRRPWRPTTTSAPLRPSWDGMTPSEREAVLSEAAQGMTSVGRKPWVRGATIPTGK